MATLYLHIGPHKTGSTYLQLEFSNHENALQSEAIVYPKTGREFGYAHHNVAWLYKRRPLINATPEQISKNLHLLEYDKLLMSSEEFMRLSEMDLQTFRADFQAYSFHILYFLRNDIGLVVSLWQTLIKHGFTVPLNELDHGTVVREFSYDPLAHEDNILKFRKSLQGSVTVFDYNELRSRRVDILSAICSVLGVKLCPSGKIINKNMSVEVIELIRAANTYSKLLGHPSSWDPRKFTLSILSSPVGTSLREYVVNKLTEVSSRLTYEHFVLGGFRSLDDGSEDYQYIPGNLLFDELNKDNIKAWATLKEQISSKNTLSPSSQRIDII